MNPDEFVEKLLKAIEDASQEHKNAPTEGVYCYTLGKIDAYKKVFEWIKD